MKVVEQLSPHFSREELQCPCCGRCEMMPELLERLELFRAYVGHPLVVNSGYRCALHNAKIRGAVRSQHLLGRAVDIAWGRPSKFFLLYIEAATQLEFKGIGLSKKFIHLDVRDTDQVDVWFY